MEIVTVSSRGQLVIPKDIRDILGIKNKDRLFVMQKDDSILLKRMNQDVTKKGMLKLMDYFSEKFNEEGITREDVKNEIKAYREEKRKLK
ncbi:MAG: AbrB family transcriptional regulator [Candidatus Altiarchaeales archaeon HGW-Altiarchaeales-1]|nr:MAG: AbrB family transcriptional regulator [Candidatus Altiarchaeales archaeon HGW-Altiarchaeales-1]